MHSLHHAQSSAVKTAENPSITPAAVEFRQVDKFFGPHHVIHKVDFRVTSGQVHVDTLDQSTRNSQRRRDIH